LIGKIVINVPHIVTSLYAPQQNFKFFCPVAFWAKQVYQFILFV